MNKSVVTLHLLLGLLFLPKLSCAMVQQDPFHDIKQNNPIATEHESSPTSEDQCTKNIYAHIAEHTFDEAFAYLNQYTAENYSHENIEAVKNIRQKLQELYTQEMDTLIAESYRAHAEYSIRKITTLSAALRVRHIKTLFIAKCAIAIINVRPQQELLLAQCLISSLGLKHQDIHGYTALHLAVQANNIQIVGWLLEQTLRQPLVGKNFINIRNYNGQTALDLARGPSTSGCYSWCNPAIQDIIIDMLRKNGGICTAPHPDDIA